MALAIVTVADSISKLTVTGVNFRDLDAIPSTVRSRDCPIFYPRPDGFLSGIDVERVSVGSGSTAQLDVRYSLNYRYLHSKIGAERGLFSVFPAMVTKVAAILDKILVSDAITGVVDLQLVDVGDFGPVSDPMGNMFHGCDISLEILEFVN